MKFVFKIIFTLFCSGLGALATYSQSTSTSESTTLLHAPAGSAAGGGQVSSGSGVIVAQISVGGTFTGQVSNVTSGGVQLKPNYIGQLYDPTTVEVAANPTTIPEGGTRQLMTTVALDDGTSLMPDPADLSWDFETGLSGIAQNTAIATAAPVFADTSTSVAATYAGLNSPALQLLVLNTAADNYLAYADDGLDDAWQVNYFDLPPNEDAAPTANPDGDPFNNADEFLTGFSPMDGGDFLRLTVASYDAGTTHLVINKVLPGRLYTVRTSDDLSGAFSDLITGSPLTYESETTDAPVQDTAAGTSKFYVLEVEFGTP